MASIAAALPRTGTRHVRPWVVTAGLCAAAAALYGWMRVPLGVAEAQRYHSICAQVGMRPSDWLCAITQDRTIASQVGSSLFTWLALAFPGAVLAASGRRYTWAIPVGLAAATTVLSQALGNGGAAEGLFGVSISPFVGAGHPSGVWFSHPLLASVADLTLVSIPAVAIAFVFRPPRRPRASTPKRHAAWVATFAITGSIVAMQMVWPRSPISDLVQANFEHSLVAIAFIALAGAMVGTDRRFWPWWLAPAAVLLSLGPTAAAVGIPSRFVASSWFAGVAPLAVAGLLGSLWRPVAMRLSGASAVGAPPSVERADRSVRPNVVLNAVAVALLLLSAIAVRTDPLPIQISTSLPTYLGVREAAEDTRAEMNLLVAIDALDTYRGDHGSFAGFEPATGERLAPSVDWSNSVGGWPLDVAVVDVSAVDARVVVGSTTGAVYCARTDGRVATYGSATSERGKVLDAAVVRRAVAACDSTPLTEDAARTLDMGQECAVADEQALVVCRSVQRLVERTLASPTIH
jgi:hypothetical protein